MSDMDLESNMNAIMSSIIDIINASQNYETIYLPSDGFGTGMAKLNIKAPKTYEMLNFLIRECFGVKY